MATVLPPNTSPSATQTHGASSNIALAENIPTALTQKSIGDIIEAEVLKSSSTGSLEVQTNLGKITLSSALNFAKGEKLLLLLQNLLPQPTFLIRRNTIGQNRGRIKNPTDVVMSNSKLTTGITDTVVSKSNEINFTQSTANVDGKFQSVPTSNLTKFNVGGVVKATIFKADASQTKTPNQRSSGSVENNLVWTTSQAAKDYKGANSTSTFLEGTAHSGNTPGYSGSGAYFSIGSKLELQLTDTISGITIGNDPSHKTNLVPGQVIQGRVISINNIGHPIVETPLGYIMLEITPQITIDGVIPIEIVSAEDSMLPAPSLSDTVSSLFTNRNWPALNEALELIQSSETVTNQQFSTLKVPKLDSQMAANILFFISALRGGDIRNWLGNQAGRRIQNNSPELYARLAEEYNQLGQSVRETNTGDWRTTLIPLFNGSEFEFFQMNFRSGSNDPNKKEDEDFARFIVDLELSKLGRIQLDGLISSKGKQFDLFVRSAIPFTKSMRRDLNKIFSECIEITGLSGNIIMQSALQFIDIPVPKMTSNYGSGVVV